MCGEASVATGFRSMVWSYLTGSRELESVEGLVDAGLDLRDTGTEESVDIPVTEGAG